MKTKQRTFYAGSSSQFVADYPLECPHCGGFGTPDLLSSCNTFCNGYHYHLFILFNNCCDSISQAIYSSQNKEGHLLALLPQTYKEAELPESICKISPRFVTLYSQCYEAEQNNYLELAGSGYRNALEILIKDFAINVLGESSNKVEDCNLSKAIELFLPTVTLSKSADVVRVLGNDYTHYQRKYDDIDFQILKAYIQIFIDNIDATYLIKYPVVRTNPNLVSQ